MQTIAQYDADRVEFISAAEIRLNKALLEIKIFEEGGADAWAKAYDTAWPGHEYLKCLHACVWREKKDIQCAKETMGTLPWYLR